MRPTVICHLLQSIDGKIAGPFFGLPEVGPLAREYARIGESLEADAVAYGTTTLDELFIHGARPELPAVYGGPAARTDYVRVCDAEKYLVAIDPHGRLGWTSDKPVGRPSLADAHIVEVLCEDVSDAYLAHLERLGVSYIFAGEQELELAVALEKLGRYFGIGRVLLQGGGIVDGSFAAEGLVDELSLVVAPVIDCSTGVPTAFETGPFLREPIAALAFELLDVERLAGGGLWLHYGRDARD